MVNRILARRWLPISCQNNNYANPRCSCNIEMTPLSKVQMALSFRLGFQFSRLDALTDLAAGRMGVSEACEILGLRRRQMFRLLRAFRRDGAVSLVSKRRGRPSNNRLPTHIRELAMTLVRGRYADFGPTLATEKLLELHGCPVSRETVRKWMIEDGLWLDRRRRMPSVHQPRNRRERLGELIQIDGSQHFWFENRAPGCTLLAYIDDATSRLMHAAFVPSESSPNYLRETQRYVRAHGRPIAFYSDKHPIFQVNNTAAAGGDGMTQFGRALHKLNIDITCANSPAAKGRIERSFGTLQDRPVKELRLVGISTIEAANAFLQRFLDNHNDASPACHSTSPMHTGRSSQTLCSRMSSHGKNNAN